MNTLCLPFSRGGSNGAAVVQRGATLFAVISTLLVAPGTPSVFADADHNPIGVTGVFEGMITTGCAYNVLSHNARREIDDIVVPGAIGKYGLKMTRYYNSRSYSAELGAGWTHEYDWEGDILGNLNYPNGDQRDVTCPSPPLGVSDYWQNSDFRLADGGAIHFDSSNGYFQVRTITDPYGQTTTLTYYTSGTYLGLLKQVTEPGGRYLQFTYSAQVNGLQMLTEVDAYDGVAGHPAIDWVRYNYTSELTGGNTVRSAMCLTSVDYSDGQHANYTYQVDNVPDHPGPPYPDSIRTTPLLRGADDVRYRGPMRRIAYQYPDQGAHGAILNEKYWDGVPGDEGNGVAVSSIAPTPPPPLIPDTDLPTTFTETRGDTPTRTFNYTALHLSRNTHQDACPIATGPAAPQQFLTSYTDFQGHTTWIGYDPNTWYVTSVTDARGSGPGDPSYTTYYTRGPAPPNGIGQITQIKHPDNTTINYDYSGANGGPWYVMTITNKRHDQTVHDQTVHTRDSNHRITQTDYKDANGTVLARETFTYCDQADTNQCGPVNPTTGQMHGQIKTQRLKNGAYVHYRYDAQGRGLLVDKWEPTWSPSPVEAEPKTHYVYYTSGPWTDRLQTKTLPANSSGYQASETYEYDRALDANGITDPNGVAVGGRGLVTKITHADTPSNTYQQFKYDAYGNKRWEDNELRKPTSYTYDEYNRLTNVTRPLNGITTYTYKPTNGSGDRLSHTTSNPDTVTVRTSATTNIITNNVYDQNFRKTSSTEAFGTSQAATTWLHYDAVGNQDYVTDPRGSSTPSAQWTTYTDYDSRNRKIQVREPLSRTTQFYYDDDFNLTRTIRAVGAPEATTETKAYDGMNRVLTDTVQKQQGVDIVTQFQYNPWTGDPMDSGHSASLLVKVIDGENHGTTFKYDPSGLKTKMTYPDNNNSFQLWVYDNVHNLANRTTVGGEIQSFTYDIRNRKTGMSWNNGADWASFTYYADNRLATASNANSAVTRTYDDAGRLASDQQNVTGMGSTWNVTYPWYSDNGQLQQLYVSGSYNIYYTHDAMGRLDQIQPSGSPLFQYHYDAASNEIGRDNLVNGVTQSYPRDQLDQIESVTVPMPASQWTMRELYGYWTIGRLNTVTHENNRQDQFDYFLDGELKTATYNAVATPSPTPSASPSPTPTPTPGGQVAEPWFSPGGGNIYPYSDISVAISTDTAGAQIRYTLDGGNTWTTIANGASTAPFQPGVGGKTLTAIAFKSGMTDSNPHSDYYWREDPRGTPDQGDTVRTVSYTLDRAGNRTSVVDAGTPTTYTLNPNNLNEYSQVGVYAVTNGHEHEISDFQGLHYTYINDERLSVVSAGRGVSYQLAYDALGRCVKRTLNGAQTSVTTYFIYDGEKPIGEIDGSGTIVGINVYGKGVDEILERGAYGTDNLWHWCYFQQDHEGNVRYLTDSSGAILEYYLYDAFGAPSIWGPPPTWTQRSNSIYNNRFMFTGREFAPLGFYEYRARAYHPGLGRFMSEDPKDFDAGDYNLFRYCHNDPIDMTDPMGTEMNFADIAPREHSVMSASQRVWERQMEFSSSFGAISYGMAAYAYSQLQQAMGATVTGQGIPSSGTQGSQSSSGSTPTSFRILEGQTKDHGTWSEYEYQAYVNGKPTYTSTYEVKEKMKEIYSSKNVDFRDSGRDWQRLNHGKWSDGVGFHGRLPRMAVDIHEQQFFVRKIGDPGSGALMQSHFLHMSNVSQGRVDNVVVDMGPNGYYGGH